MEYLLIPAFLFFIGSTVGWVIELIFRRFFSSANPERKWINPGLCTGPYLPLYGCGLCVLYLLSSLGEAPILSHPVWNKVVLYLCMAVCMTAIEYIAGIFSLKVAKVRLWDYSKQWGNVQGIICPKFSLAWAAIGVAYDLLIHPHIRVMVRWLSQNLAFSFFIGVFFGVFLVDFVHATNLLRKLKRFAEENGVIVRFEAIKRELRLRSDALKERYRFFQPFRTGKPLNEQLREMKESFERRMPRTRHGKK